MNSVLQRHRFGASSYRVIKGNLQDFQVKGVMKGRAPPEACEEGCGGGKGRCWVEMAFRNEGGEGVVGVGVGGAQGERLDHASTGIWPEFASPSHVRTDVYGRGNRGNCSRRQRGDAALLFDVTLKTG